MAVDPIGQLLAFHERIRLVLDALDDLAKAAEDGEVDPLHAQAIADFFSGPLVWHDVDEELSLMPRLRRASPDAELSRVVAACARAHDTMEARIDASLPHLRAIGERKEPPSPVLLRKLAKVMRQLLEPHLHIEESALFPRARQLFDDDTLRAIQEELSRREADRQAGGVRTAMELAFLAASHDDVDS